VRPIRGATIYNLYRFTEISDNLATALPFCRAV